MSMDFGPHFTDLKMHSGTFRTANGFQWYMTSVLSCFFFFFIISLLLTAVALQVKSSPFLEPTIQTDEKSVKDRAGLFFVWVKNNEDV